MVPLLMPLMNRYYTDGCLAAQGALRAEAAGDNAHAALLYGQAIGLLRSSGNLAEQMGLPIHDQGFAIFGFCHYRAAMVKTALGQASAAVDHLAQAWDAMSRALSINPYFAPYHALAGQILLAQGKLPLAEQSFQNAAQRGGLDTRGQYMLELIRTLQEKAAHVTPTSLGAPPLPIQGSRPTDWLTKISGVLKVTTQAVQLFDQLRNTFGGSSDWRE